MSRLSIAVVGASKNRAKFGNKCVRAYAAAGYDVYPVNPRADVIEGLTALPSLADVPVDRLDRISVYLPAHVCLALLPQIAAKPAHEVWFNPGADDAQVMNRAQELGINAIAGCSIVDIGASPNQF